MIPDWVEEGLKHVWLPYTAMGKLNPPLPVVKTQGTDIHLADGRVLLDGLASWWTACHGYNHPHILAAVKEQLDTVPHIMFGGLLHEPALSLAKRLVDILPGEMERVFFSDSGSVSVEVALKIAVQHWFNQGEKGRTKFLCFKNGYHGDTLGAMAVSDPEGGMHERLKGFIPESIICDIPITTEQKQDFAVLIKKERKNIAAIIIEPLVQGAGGMKFHSPDSLRFIWEVAQKEGVIFIADEVMTGFCRLGPMFACTEAEITPDIICLSKALTGGTLGLGATVVNKRVFAAFNSQDSAHILMHGPSFMANPLACRAALASLDLFAQEPRLNQVKEIEEALREGLAPCRKYAKVKDVRIKGACGVVEFAEIPNIQHWRRRFPEEGVFLRPFGNIVYIMPSLIIKRTQVATLCQVAEKITDEISR